MLEKIINIKPAMSYQGGKKKFPSSFEKFINKPYARNAFGSDSLVFSPAAVFLSRINWHLKEIDIFENEKLKINFYIDNIEFETKIDISEIYNTNERKYIITKEHEIIEEKKRAEAIVLLKKDKIFLSENYGNENINGITTFIKKIFNADFSFELTSSEKYLIDDLLYGIDEKMIEEFYNIDSALFTFINKLEKFPPLKNHSYEDEILIPMQIDKVKINRD